MPVTKRKQDNAFDRFVESFQYWQKRLELGKWTVMFEQRELDATPAHIEIANVGLFATARMDPRANKELYPFCSPEHLGRHEALELLIAPLKSCAENRYGISSDDVVATSHELIHVLETILAREPE